MLRSRRDGHFKGSYEDGQLIFQIRSTEIFTEGLNETGKKYVSYGLVLLKVKKGTKEEDPNLVSPPIYRRYTDFLELYERLKKDYPAHMAPIIFPRKCFVGNFTEEVITIRLLSFESLLNLILANGELRDSDHLLRFLQDRELGRACRLLDERRTEGAIPILENCFTVLNKIFTDCSKPVLLMLCRLVAASSHPIPSADACKWAELALRRFEKVCDADILALYIPLIKACVYLFWKTGRDKTHLDDQLEGMRKRGFNVETGPTLQQAIHNLDPRTETA